LALLDKIEGSGPPLLQATDPYSIFGPEAFAPTMRLAIAEKDDGRLPAELLHNKMLDNICNDELTIMFGPTSPATKAACKVRRDREAKEEQETEAAFEENSAWRDKPEERDKACGETPAEKRSKGLQIACDDAQQYRDQVASLDLGKQPEKLAADCAARPETSHTGPMRYACQDFDSAVGEQLGELLITDNAAYQLMCVFETGDPDVGPPDRSRIASDGCSWAKVGIEVAAVKKLMTDLPALAVRCKAYGDSYDDEALTSACRDLEQALMEKNARRLFEDKAAFDRECSRFRTKMKDDWITNSEKERACRSAWELQTNRISRLPNDPIPEDKAGSKSSGETALGGIRQRIDSTAANKPLQSVARKQAEAIISKAKAEGTYPKRKPSDRF
jgi:hypothetical protein